MAFGRYGLIGQNGVGKTTLLNRLAAKDINGFPTDLRTWYIRHEVLPPRPTSSRPCVRHAPVTYLSRSCAATTWTCARS